MTVSRVEKEAAGWGGGEGVVVGLSQSMPASNRKSSPPAKDVVYRGSHGPTPTATAALTTRTTAAGPSGFTASHQASDPAANFTPNSLSASTSPSNPTCPPSPSSSSPPPSPSAPPSPTGPDLTSKIAQLQTQITTLEHELSTTHAQLASKANTQLHHPGPGPGPGIAAPPDVTASAAETIVRRHIKLLRDYNAIKDVALGLMGLIADARGARLEPVMAEFGVAEKD